ncbi:hypothetical protein PS15m_005609 [Mucor circinelloides]
MSAFPPTAPSNPALPPPKPPRAVVGSRHHSVSSGTDNANKKMPPAIPPKRLSVNCAFQPRSSLDSSSSSAALIKDTAAQPLSPPMANKKSSPIANVNTVGSSSIDKPVSAHEISKRRDSISSLLSNSSLETYLNEIKQLGRQVKRQLLEDEDIMSAGNRMMPATPRPSPAVRRSRAISLGSVNPRNDIDDLVRQQQEQLLDSFKQAKQALTPPSASETSVLVPSKSFEKEKRSEATVPNTIIPPMDGNKPNMADEQTTTPIVYADEKRNTDFHMLFRSVPENDRLIEEYNCAMYKDILVQGKLYISQEHLCFNAKFFGWVTNLVIAYKDIKSIEKRNMALIVPNGIQITTHSDTKHVFASFMTRDYTFDLVYQTWQTSLFPKKEVNEINDPLLLPLPAQKDDHADLVNQHVAQEQTLPEETAVDNKQLPQQDMENKQYQWIVMDQAFIGTVEGLYKLLYQSDFVHQYLTVMVQCQEVQFGSWDPHSKTRSSSVTKDGIQYKVTDTEVYHQQDAKLCISTTVTSKRLVDLRCKVCITRKTNTEIEAVISIQDQQYIPLFKSFQRLLSRKSTRATIQQLSEGRTLDTCWQHSKRLALQQKYIVPGIQIMKQTYLVLVLSVQSAYQHAQSIEKGHWLILSLFVANLLILHHMNSRVVQLEHQQRSPFSLIFPTTAVPDKTADSVELNHIEFMQLRMNEIKQKMAALHQDVVFQKQQLLNESEK